MKSTKDDEKRRMLESLDYIDDDIVSGVLEKIEARKGRVPQVKKNFAFAWKLAAAVAACLLLLTMAVPTTVTLFDSIDLFTPAKGDNSNLSVESSPEYDGSRGLLYKVREDGETAAFVGFGSCTDEVVYVASHYNGLPVVEMKNEPYYEATYVPADHPYGNKVVKRLVVSDTVEYIWAGVIDLCPNIESVYFGANLKYIKPLFFNRHDGMDLASVEVSPENKNYSDKGNCLVDLRTNELVIGLPTTVIPDDGSVKIIGFYAFNPAKWSLKSIVIPEGVKIIDHGAFAGCTELESVTLPDSLEVVEVNAFNGCKKLVSLELGTNLKAFDQHVFHRMYCPTISYKGSVEQWAAVIKTSISNASLSIPVICADGNSLSDAGKQGNYNWLFLPEYEECWEARFPDRPQPQFDPE